MFFDSGEALFVYRLLDVLWRFCFKYVRWLMIRLVDWSMHMDWILDDMFWSLCKVYRHFPEIYRTFSLRYRVNPYEFGLWLGWSKTRQVRARNTALIGLSTIEFGADQQITFDNHDSVSHSQNPDSLGHFPSRCQDTLKLFEALRYTYFDRLSNFWWIAATSGKRAG